MSRRTRSESPITIAEGLLPLLDCSILLLGLFMILLASGAFSPRSAASASESTVPGISQVILLTVTKGGELGVSSGNKENVTKLSSVDDLNKKLQAIKKTRGESAPLVLVYYEDPWADLGRDLNQRIRSAILNAGCRYALSYP